MPFLVSQTISFKTDVSFSKKKKKESVDRPNFEIARHMNVFFFRVQFPLSKNNYTKSVEFRIDPVNPGADSKVAKPII